MMPQIALSVNLFRVIFPKKSSPKTKRGALEAPLLAAKEPLEALLGLEQMGCGTRRTSRGAENVRWVVSRSLSYYEAEDMHIRT